MACLAATLTALLNLMSKSAYIFQNIEFTNQNELLCLTNFILLCNNLVYVSHCKKVNINHMYFYIPFILIYLINHYPTRFLYTRDALYHLTEEGSNFHTYSNVSHKYCSVCFYICIFLFSKNVTLLL